VIVADDLGYTDLGLLGSEIRTPNLDALARQGLLLTRFYVSPACSPTRAMLLSGADPHRAGLGTMVGEQSTRQEGQPGYEGVLGERVVSLAALLQEAGYHTSMAGKWHLGGGPGEGPERRGFERSFGLVGGGASHFSDATTLLRSDGPAAYLEDGEVVSGLPDDFYSSDAYTDRLIGFMREGLEAGRPLFGYAAYTSPHWPLQVPDARLEGYRGVYDAGYEALLRRRAEAAAAAGLVPGDIPPPALLPFVPAWDGLDPDERAFQARVMEVYAAMVENLDHNVGRLLAFLADAGQLEHTLVLFFSDNGAEGNPIGNMSGNAAWIAERFDNRLENVGRRDSYVYLGPGWAQATTGPFRHFKAFASEGGVRVPAIVRAPARGFAPGGRRSDAVVSVLDLAPTLLELGGVSPPGATWRGRPVAPLEGISMGPLLRGEKETLRGPADVLGWELFGRRAVLKGEWKLSWTWPPYGPGEWELFHLASDPGERTDRSGTEPEKRAELLAEWQAYARRNGVVLPERDSSYALEVSPPR
jgi:arylsulfatase